MAQNFPRPSVSPQNSLPTLSKIERGGAKTRICKKKSGQAKQSLSNPTTSEKRPPGRPKKEDLAELDLTKKDDKAKLRKRRYAQNYRARVRYHCFF